MVKGALKSWYAEAVEGAPQTAGFLLPRMALTFTDPKHRDRLIGSCHAKATAALRFGHEHGLLTPEHRILMIGPENGQRIFHTIVTDKNGAVAYDSLADEQGCMYHHETRDYESPDWSERVQVKLDLSFGDFLKHYVSKITIPGRPQGPAGPANP